MPARACRAESGFRHTAARTPSATAVARPHAGAVRLHRIWTPPETVHYGRLALLVAAAVLVGGISAMAAGVFAVASALQGGGSVWLVAYLLSLLAFTAPAVLVGTAIREWRGSKQPCPRTARLERIAAHPDATRLPHRLVELTWRRGPNPRELARLVTTLPPRRLIVVNGPRGGPLALPDFVDREFEPAQLPHEAEQLLDGLADRPAVRAEDPAGCGAVRATRTVCGGEQHSASRNGRRRMWNLILFAVAMLPASVETLHVVMGRARFEWHSPFWLMLGALLLVCAIPYIVEQRMWLVPGGVVCCGHAAWRRKPRLRVMWAGVSSLIVDLRDGRAVAAVDRRVVILPCAGRVRAALALLAAWRSTARRPTMEELRTLFDPENA